jgi:hypothetical protein
MDERRRSTRIIYMTSARLANDRGVWESAVRDISADGIFLATPRKFTAGERLQIGFRLRHSGRTFDLDAEIKRVTPDGVGIEIIWV